MDKEKRKKRKASQELDLNQENKLKTQKDKKETKILEKSVPKTTEKKQNKPKQATLEKFNIKIDHVKQDAQNFVDLPKGTKLSIYSYNVNGLRATINKGSLLDFIKKENPDILCLNETKIDINTIKNEKYEKIYFSDYLCYWNCSQDKAGYSGVAVLTKFKPLNVTYGIEKDSHDGEGRVITLEFNNFYLISVYVPNAGEKLKRLDYRVKEWDVEFQEYLNNLRKKKNIILCGDLNVAHKDIDIFSPKGHDKSAGFTKEERESFTKFLDSGYIDTFRHLHPSEVKFTYFSARRVTHKAENKGWRLDYFVINEESKSNLIESEILNDYSGSDHSPIKLTYDA